MRPRLTYANVTATLALVIAVGGASAFAATQLAKNSVGAKQLKKNSVTTAKIKNEAITAAKVKKGTLTGTQINASTLGTVPIAQTAQSAQTANAIAAPEPWHVVGAPGEPQFENGCHSEPNGTFPVSFYKDREGVVHLRGIYAFCSVAGSIAFQLPPGYRPGFGEEFPLARGAELLVKSGTGEFAGAVNCDMATCVLDGITFRAES